MPQMMPMNWLILMIYFILFYFLILTLNYYFINYQPKNMPYSKNNITFFWKW
uniref:ATP synthase F0 subunit 8 n=1 Tax=Phyllotreta striolata TaxID=444603 RepID=UPI0013B45340|nr:ATP synthase F0 subunit 8 [Phyllotreta striolata]QHR79684.1 ATP synthase F0 subunit 8 [Phyllotreta striolata]UPE50054.1 ATP synthase F0 subunit 8 [Phyllotreta striolata]WDV10355.1 ATP synthase F0 subunit 8 [Phyllotreta striolata]